MTRMYNTPVFVRAYWRALEEALNGFFRIGPRHARRHDPRREVCAFQANGINLIRPRASKAGSANDARFLLTQLNTVSNVFKINGTNYFSTNRNLVTLTGSAPLACTRSWSTASLPHDLDRGDNVAMTIPVTTGTNVLNIQGLDRLGNALANAGAALTVNFTGTDEPPENSIVINEIMYKPPSCRTRRMSKSITVHQATRSTFQLAAQRCGASPFPPGTIITNGQFLVIVKNRTAFGSAYGYSIPASCEFNGRLDNGGETLSLIKPGRQGAGCGRIARNLR